MTNKKWSPFLAPFGHPIADALRCVPNTYPDRPTLQRTSLAQLHIPPHYSLLLCASMANNETHLYVGGLAEAVTEPVLRAAFIPYGEIVDVHIPMADGRNKGFGFVSFQLAEDAAAAIANLDDGELFGRRIRVNLSKPTSRARGKAVWYGEQPELDPVHPSGGASNS